MTKLLVQSDDYGFTKAVTLGINDAIENGICRNTGMFTNMPAAVLAAELAKKHPEACYGIDFNLVAGKPVSDPKDIPSLVDENGNFRKSGYYVRQEKYWTEEGQNELFPYDEVRTEIRAQYAKFLELMGTKPGYFHGHSITPANYLKAIEELAEEENIPYSRNNAKLGATPIAAIAVNPDSKSKTFNPDYQLKKSTTDMVLDQADKILSSDLAVIICHAGFMDDELLGLTSLSIERVKDHAMMTSDRMKQFIADNNIELVTYTDLYKK